MVVYAYSVCEGSCVGRQRLYSRIFFWPFFFSDTVGQIFLKKYIYAIFFLLRPYAVVFF